MTIHSQTIEIVRSGQFWGFAHYSRSLRSGAHRFDTQSEAGELSHVAFENPDGEKVLILTNPAAEKKVELQMGQAKAEISLPRDSVTTCIWR